MKLKLIFFLFAFTFTSAAFSQKKSDTIKVDSVKLNKKVIKPKKWNFIVLPNIGYDSDLGLAYGGLSSIYYCKGVFPDFKHFWYVEWTHYSKGSDKKLFQFETKTLIPHVRFAFDLTYHTEQALDFLGFNGYESVFDKSYIDVKDGNYISRMFYKHERKMLKIMVNLKGVTHDKRLRWVSGVTYLNMKIKTVNIDKLNEDKSGSDILPAVDLMYDKYVKWGIISQNEKSGGQSLLLKLGLDFDSRDLEADPSRGVWSAIVLMQGHSFLPQKDMNFTQFVLTHRQYFTLVKNHLTFAYRLNYQGKLFGEIPFFMLPFMYNSFGSPTDGLGGGATLRGVIRNRLVGDEMVFGNAEVRWKVFQVRILKQMVGLGVTPYIDAGMIIKNHEYKFIDDKAKTESEPFIKPGEEKLHVSYGSGVHYIINQNIIGTLYFGLPLNKNDGFFGLYMSFNYLF